MDFIGSAATSHGVTERRFDVKREDDLVPGIVWTPEGATGSRPLVLVGHGGSANKRTPYVLSLARRLVRHAGYAVAAIDAPHHGDRVTGSSPSIAGSAVGFREVVAAASDGMVADWTATVAELQALEEVGEGPLGYWGVSMGTMLGVPFVAATPAVRCAVLGLMGTFTDDDPWTVAAGAVDCPVLFLVQTDDELIPTERALSLFRSIGAEDKRLHAHPGAHSAMPPEEMEASEALFARHLV
ncbi:MAG: dienelactone hydrolase family protein [Acidimicrobiales bacterium]